MVVSKRKREANQRNAQLAKGPHDTSLTRRNALKHGILSEQVLIRTGAGKEDPEEFQQFSDAMREAWAPVGAMEEYLVEELIGIAWRKRRVLAYESAVISKQWDGAVEDWEQQHPIVMAHQQWAAEQTPKLTPDQPLKSTAEPSSKMTVEQLFKKIIGDQPGDSTRKHVSGLSVKPIDAYILWYVMAEMTFREVNMDEPLSSPTGRGRALIKAQQLGADVDDAIGSKPESDLYADCSSEQIQKVIDAACELKNISQDDFWEAVDKDALRDLKGAADGLVEIESERTRARDLAGLPDDASLAKIQRHEAHLSRQLYKTVHELQRLQAARHGLRPPAPLAMDVDITGDPGQ